MVGEEKVGKVVRGGLLAGTEGEGNPRGLRMSTVLSKSIEAITITYLVRG